MDTILLEESDINILAENLILLTSSFDYNILKKGFIIMGIGDVIISELSLMDLKDLISTYERLSKSENKKIKEKAEKTLLTLMEFSDKAIKNEILTPRQYNKRIVEKFGKKSNN